MPARYKKQQQKRRAGAGAGAPPRTTALCILSRADDAPLLWTGTGKLASLSSAGLHSYTTDHDDDNWCCCMPTWRDERRSERDPRCAYHAAALRPCNHHRRQQLNAKQRRTGSQATSGVHTRNVRRFSKLGARARALRTFRGTAEARCGSHGEAQVHASRERKQFVNIVDTTRGVRPVSLPADDCQRRHRKPVSKRSTTPGDKRCSGA
jgi:hypothetical protein